MTILIIEDDAAYAALLGDWLRQVCPPPVDLIQVRTIAAALERLRGVHCDVCLLDLNLPDSTGTASVARLVAEHLALPIVVITGLAEPLAIAVAELGAEEFLSKPDLTPALLWEKLQIAIARHARQQRLFTRLAEVTEALRQHAP